MGVGRAGKEGYADEEGRKEGRTEGMKVSVLRGWMGNRESGGGRGGMCRRKEEGLSSCPSILPSFIPLPPFLASFLTVKVFKRHVRNGVGGWTPETVKLEGRKGRQKIKKGRKEGRQEGM